MYNIPFSPPDITQEEIEEVIDTLKSGWITTGPKTKKFEEEISKYCTTEKSVTMNSATACMEMTLRLLGIGPGDEVITSAYTYTASASVIHHVGAKIVLVDTAKDSFEMDYDQLESAITEKTKIIIPVDIAGVMCNYERIYEIVNNKEKLFKANNDLQAKFGRVIVMADAAHSFGATYKGKPSGSVADFTCFSFHAVKNLTTGEGGAVTWRKFDNISNDYLYKQYMLLILHGQTKDALAKTKLGSWEYDIIAPNYKCNMTDIMASMGLVQLKRYNKILDRRKEIVNIYDSAFRNKNLQVLNHIDGTSESSCHLYFVRILDRTEEYRNKVIEKMAELGISTNVHYKPLPMLTAYKNLGFDIKNYPNAYKMYCNEITLPLNTLLTDDDVEIVVQELLKIIDKL